MLWRKIKYGRGIRNGEKGKKRNGEDLQLYSQAEPLSPKEGERGRSHVYLCGNSAPGRVQPMPRPLGRTRLGLLEEQPGGCVSRAE